MAFAIRRPATAFSSDPSDKAQKRITDDRHLAFIRTLPSVLSGVYGCEACHIRYGDPMYRKKHTGKAQKPDDAWTIPLTPDEHRDQHASNEREWWLAQGIDPLRIALQLYAVTGNTEAATKIILEARKQ
ncbi:hypothetical protein REJC140_00163 [Pseudorhizobium endolithicum]|uniref:DUF968 domain-containing protein n=1 Tax=Pseudorhizobium endolithicum TaxID=1191678 RepID=A0ABM8PCU2_9HYPH|nr:hypothetical protein [Pseudorhizobium endolithicum]CAD7023310.1 hypothetical protein REJC140_00163 [Pseudorhizobium endolithicum]